MMKNVMLLSFLMVSWFSRAQVQSPIAQPNVFKGVLYDLATGQRLEGASISIECDAVQTATLTDENGYFVLHGAPTTCFKITISMTGFEDKVLEKVSNVIDVEYYIGLEQKKVKQAMN